MARALAAPVALDRPSPTAIQVRTVALTESVAHAIFGHPRRGDIDRLHAFAASYNSPTPKGGGSGSGSSGDGDDGGDGSGGDARLRELAVRSADVIRVTRQAQSATGVVFPLSRVAHESAVAPADARLADAQGPWNTGTLWCMLRALRATRPQSLDVLYVPMHPVVVDVSINDNVGVRDDIGMDDRLIGDLRTHLSEAAARRRSWLPVLVSRWRTRRGETGARRSHALVFVPVAPAVYDSIHPVHDDIHPVYLDVCQSPRTRGRTREQLARLFVERLGLRSPSTVPVPDRVLGALRGSVLAAQAYLVLVLDVVTLNSSADVERLTLAAGLYVDRLSSLDASPSSPSLDAPSSPSSSSSSSVASGRGIAAYASSWCRELGSAQSLFRALVVVCCPATPLPPFAAAVHPASPRRGVLPHLCTVVKCASRAPAWLGVTVAGDAHATQSATALLALDPAQPAAAVPQWAAAATGHRYGNMSVLGAFDPRSNTCLQLGVPASMLRHMTVGDLRSLQGLDGRVPDSAVVRIVLDDYPPLRHRRYLDGRDLLRLCTSAAQAEIRSFLSRPVGAALRGGAVCGALAVVCEWLRGAADPAPAAGQQTLFVCSADRGALARVAELFSAHMAAQWWLPVAPSLSRLVPDDSSGSRLVPDKSSGSREDSEAVVRVADHVARHMRVAFRVGVRDTQGHAWKLVL